MGSPMVLVLVMVRNIAEAPSMDIWRRSTYDGMQWFAMLGSFDGHPEKEHMR